MRNFYKEASHNNIDFVSAEETCGTTNDRLATVTLTYPCPTPSGSINNTYRQLTKDAITAVNGCVNFASFDTNSNGYISTNELHIVTIIAG